MKVRRRLGRKGPGRAARPLKAPRRRTVPLLLHTRFVRLRLPNGELGPVQPAPETGKAPDLSGFIPIHLPTLRAPAGFTLAVSDDGGAAWNGAGTKARQRRRNGNKGRRGRRGA